jgi:hypothetical protein
MPKWVNQSCVTWKTSKSFPQPHNIVTNIGIVQLAAMNRLIQQFVANGPDARMRSHLEVENVIKGERYCIGVFWVVIGGWT